MTPDPETPDPKTPDPHPTAAAPDTPAPPPIDVDLEEADRMTKNIEEKGEPFDDNFA